jgi:AraC-like DNA-binding protein
MIHKREFFKSTEYFTCDTTPKRTVQYYEFEIYDYGTGCASINNVLFPHSNNMVIFAKPTQERFTIGSFNCYAIKFSCEDRELCKLLNTVPDCVVVDSLTKKELLELFMHTEKNDDLEAWVSIWNMVNVIKNLGKNIPSDMPANYNRIRKVKEFIDNNYQNSINTMEFEKLCNLSINYIRKQFLDCYGVTIHRYITDLRLSHVKKLLLSTELQLCDIAYESGFNSQSHMNFMFKSFYGMSPLQYKKKKYMG